jgi:hypothetical protein
MHDPFPSLRETDVKEVLEREVIPTFVADIKLASEEMGQCVRLSRVKDSESERRIREEEASK